MIQSSIGAMHKILISLSVISMLAVSSIYAQSGGGELGSQSPPSEEGRTESQGNPEGSETEKSPGSEIASGGNNIDPHAILRELENDVLRVVIHARVRDDSDTVLWNMDIDELTVPGRGVQVRLNGENLVVEAEFTAYRQQDGTIMLIAQGQTWVRNNADNKLRYQTSLKSIPIEIDESVVFYPLGVASNESGNMNLELEIIISNYIIAQDSSSAEVDGDS